ncbi:MAG: NADH-quinone oxidoreductase subunit C [Lachnospiraceae bacterium]|nr:NADH-quinone oxidoreductase subunit C [Lachnospiraceae bacterium]
MEDYGRNIVEITTDQLVIVASEERDKNHRLSQACASYVNDKYELLYTFSDGYEMTTYKLFVGLDEEVPSISRIFFPAFTYENEMKELFGVKIMGIVTDYNNKFYRIAKETPFLKKGDK